MIDNPLSATPPTEIPLENSPLVSVLAQVRFPAMQAMENREVVAPFQEAIAETYPEVIAERTQGVVISPKGVQSKEGVIWRFHDESKTWRVTLAPEFLSLEAQVYGSRRHFIRRFEDVLDAFELIAPPIIDRVGVRYVNRLLGDEFTNLPALVRPELAGFTGTDLGDAIIHTMSESVFTLPDNQGQLLARWGRIPKSQTPDPNVFKPISEVSWVLDIDTFKTESRGFDVPSIIADAERFAERNYTFFRWAVTDAFLTTFQ